MKLLDKSISKKLHPVIITKDDFRELVNYLKQCGFKNITIETPTHEYNTDEIDKIENHPAYLSIHSHEPYYLTLNIGSSYSGQIELSINDNSAECLGIITHLENFFRKRERIIFSVIIDKRFNFFLIILVGSFLAILWGNDLITTKTAYIFLIIQYLLFTFLIFLEMIKFIRKNIIEINPPIEKKSKWSKHLTNIFIQFIIGLLLLIGYLLLPKIF